MTKADLYEAMIECLTSPGSVKATVFTEHSLEKLLTDLKSIVGEYNKANPRPKRNLKFGVEYKDVDGTVKRWP